MAQSRKRSGSRRSSKPKPTFRGQVPLEVVDRLLYRFVALVKQGLRMRSVNPLDYRTGTSPDGAIRPQSESPTCLRVRTGRLPWARFAGGRLRQVGRVLVKAEEPRAERARPPEAMD